MYHCKVGEKKEQTGSSRLIAVTRVRRTAFRNGRLVVQYTNGKGKDLLMHLRLRSKQEK